ncbi:MAG: biopolymer transporter ExbD [Calditrichaeota bacterium]|nr:biopolymer transporter ExbD [Candidatus Cloacimonadota bacterium]MCA9786077.1 biopolymer transporter ExbD [Candidatus Cloacimonadota bacterium]MCB1046107.1 biopolymer transporter ExbD [Calditrichota bacterium]MCB9473359.1 biopolymer transporter ExbD [Candidatus Delongbacteria bacterium]
MAAAPSHMRKHRGSQEETIPLASMMDMMTIILLFLLKSYSTSGGLVTQVDKLELPGSSSKIAPKSALSIAVDAGRSGSAPGIYVEVNGTRTEMLDGGEVLDVNATSSMELPVLKAFLTEKASEARESESRYGIPFTGTITIQADKAINYNSVLKVLQTCADAGYPKTDFVIIKEE